MGVLAVGLVVSALLAAISHALTQRATVLPGLGPWLPGLVGVLWFAGLFSACMTIGPASAEPAARTWVVSSPSDRAAALFPRSAKLAAACAGVGGVGGLIIAYCIDPHGPSALTLTGITTSGVLTGFATHQLALAAQATFTRKRNLRKASATVALLACATIAATAPMPWRKPAATTLTWALVTLASLAIVFAIATIGWSRHWLRRVRLVDLIDGGDIALAVAGSVATFDSTPLELRDERRALSRRARYRSARRLGNVYLDLAVRDVLDLPRRINVATRLLLIFAVWALAAIFGAQATIICGAWLSYSAAVAASVRLRRWLGSSAIWLAFPQPPQRVSSCLSVSGLIVATGVAALCTIGSQVPVSFALTAGPAAIAALVRRCYRPPMAAGPLMSTPAGALPVGLLVSTCYGIDLGATCLAVGATFGWWIGCAVSTAALGWTLWRALPGGTKRPVLRLRRSPDAAPITAGPDVGATRWDG